MENQTNIDELFLKTIAEHLNAILKNQQILDEKISKKDTGDFYKDLHKMGQSLNEISRNIETQTIYVKSLPKNDYSSLFIDFKNRLSKFNQDIEVVLMELQIPIRQKIIAIILIGVLIISFVISIFYNIQLHDEVGPAVINDIKYRYMKTLGSNYLNNMALKVDSIFEQKDFSELKEEIEARELLNYELYEAEMRAKAKEIEANKLRTEADQIKSKIK